MADEGGTPIKAASFEPGIRATHLLSSHPKEESKPLGYLDASTATVSPAVPDPPTGPNPPTQPLDRPTSPDYARSQYASLRVVSEDDQKIAPVAGLSSGATLLPP